MERNCFSIASSAYTTVEPRHSTELQNLTKGGFIIHASAEICFEILAPLVANLTVRSMPTMHCQWED